MARAACARISSMSSGASSSSCGYRRNETEPDPNGSVAVTRFGSPRSERSQPSEAKVAAAVDDDRLAGDVAGTITDEERHHRTDVRLRVTEPPHRNGRRQPCAELGVCSKR